MSDNHDLDKHFQLQIADCRAALRVLDLLGADNTSVVWKKQAIGLVRYLIEARLQKTIYDYYNAFNDDSDLPF